MAEFSDILVRVGADVEPLKKGFKTASEKMKGYRTEVLDAAKKTVALTAAVSGASVALVAMASNAAKDARELAGLAQVAGVSTDEFQKMAFAAKTVGVEQDKLSDIFKDTRDKVGDFLQTGAGPLADFFENIAPKVGVTAEEFRNLSGPQALQKFSSALQAANVSQSEMVFYMESIASDAAMLTPLLHDSGAAFEQLGNKAEQAGAIMSGMDIARLETMQVTLDQATAAAKRTTNAFAAEMAPVIGALADRFMEVRGETSLMQDATKKTFDFMVKAIGFTQDAIRGLHVVVKGLELGFNALGVGIFAVLETIPKSVDYVINSAKASINGLIEGLNKLPKVNIDQLVIGQSKATQIMSDFTASAVSTFKKTQEELHALAMEPMPSTAWEKFVADAQKAGDEAAMAIVTARQKALEIPVANDPKSDPLVTYADKTTEQLTAIYGRAGSKRVDDDKEKQKDALKSQKAFGSQSMSAYSSLFGNISTLMESSNKKQFEIGKKAAAAQAIIDTIASAQAAFKSLAGIPVVGPGLGVAAAGAAVVAGMARLSQINSTQFGGKSVPSGSSGGMSSGSSAAGQAGQSGAGQSQSIFIEGGVSEGDLFRGSAINGLIDRINEAGADGKTINVSVAV